MSYDYRRSPTFDKKFKKLTENDLGLKNKFIHKIGQVLDNPEIGVLKFSIIAKLPEGGCCGKPDLAQGRGPNVEKLDEALQAGREAMRAGA